VAAVERMTTGLSLLYDSNDDVKKEV